MKNKIVLVVAMLLLVLSLGGCKSKDNDKITESNTSETTSIPIVITDEDSSETDESELNEIIDKWESSTPKLEIEESKKPAETTSSKDTTTSSSTPSSSKPGQEQNGSEEDNSSSEENNSSAKPDDGYFDVAV